MFGRAVVRPGRGQAVPVGLGIIHPKKCDIGVIRIETIASTKMDRRGKLYE